MLFPDLPDIWEEETTITQQPSPITEFTAKPTGEQLSPIKFSVKPDGEFNFEGIPDSDVIEQIVTTTNYHRDQNRRYESEAQKQAQNVEKMIIGVLSAAILVSFLCLFLSYNNKQQNREESNYGRTGGVIRRTCTY